MGARYRRPTWLAISPVGECGILAALFEREHSGAGQVIDAAMIDGASLLMTFIHGLYDAQVWNPERGTNMVDGGAAYYDTYQTADGKYLAVGAVEPEFFAALTAVLELDDVDIDFQLDRASWPQWRKVLGEKFREKTRDEWEAIFADADACVSPVLTPWEGPTMTPIFNQIGPVATSCERDSWRPTRFACRIAARNPALRASSGSASAMVVRKASSTGR